MQVPLKCQSISIKPRGITFQKAAIFTDAPHISLRPHNTQIFQRISPVIELFVLCKSHCLTVNAFKSSSFEIRTGNCRIIHNSVIIRYRFKRKLLYKFQVLYSFGEF
jgi:hypothetical protein